MNNNLFNNFLDDEENEESNGEIQNTNGSKNFKGKKRHRTPNDNNDEEKPLKSQKKLTGQKETIKTDENEEENGEESDDALPGKIKNILVQSTSDYSLESKVKKLLDDQSANFDHENMIYDVYEFPGCIHENIAPKSQAKKLVAATTKPAKQYEFKLDTFQERAILSLENSQSVLVSAHTSAGKTVVAQYAIAMALRDKQRVIYTSPIKALSNQKFRELQHEFTDVGLMTGDVTINPSASCLVMTTEILRNMLYRGSEVTREMAWVIFDEVHYMRDRERGVVWEETIILLPNKVKHVFLSATIPNAKEFARWIAFIKDQPCNVVYTETRPVPLQHYIYVSGQDGIFLIVDEKGKFREENFNKAISVLNDDYDLEKIQEKNKGRKKQGAEQDIKKILGLIKDNNLDPAIVFSFSKKDCESNAMSLSKMDFTTDDEKKMIEYIYNSAIATLSDEDQQLPQIQQMLPLLKKGIGIHHGGLLPIVKESIELIFQEGLLKVLFSTETFSMGINMPAKTVIFTSIEKYDGDDFRWLTGGEYIQMSGRAGRRGLDDKGITILMLNKKMDNEVARGMLNGKADCLNSSFHLNYNMIINLLRVEGIDPEYIVKRSFHQFQSERAVPGLKTKLAQLTEGLKDYSFKDESVLEKAIYLQNTLKKCEDEIQRTICKPENLIPFLKPGRLLKIKDFGFGICINYSKKNIETTFKDKKKEVIFKNQLSDKSSDLNVNERTVETYFIDVMLYVKNQLEDDKTLVKGNIEEGNGQMGVVPVFINSVEAISSVVLDIPHDLKSKDNIKRTEQILKQVFLRLKEIPTLDPIKDLEINDESLVDNIKKKKTLISSLEELEVPPYEIDSYKKKDSLKKQINDIIVIISRNKELVLKDELKHMKRVLRRLEFINKDDSILPKGQAACLITTSDELILTEMLYKSSFNDLEPNMLCAMLSCFLVNENSKGEAQTKDKSNAQLFKNIFDKVKESATYIAGILVECKIDIDKQTYIDSFKPDMMEVTYNWANGAKFSEICNIGDIYEGTIIRSMRRLEELIRQLVECCQLIGNLSLKEKLEKASGLIKRGIIFAASLYLNA